MLVKLQPYRQSTIAHRVNVKLSKSFFGPFPVIDKVVSVAYTLKLPNTSRIHPTFHVSQLKLFKGSLPSNISSLPDLSLNNQPLLLTLRILATRIFSAHSRPVKQILVEWSNSPAEDATWENLSEFCRLYQLLDLEDKFNFEEGGSVSHMVIELDSVGIKKLIEEWTAKGTVNMEEVQNSSPVAQNNLVEDSASKVQKEEELADKKIRASSRSIKKPTWMSEYV